MMKSRNAARTARRSFSSSAAMRQILISMNFSGWSKTTTARGSGAGVAPRTEVDAGRASMAARATAPEIVRAVLTDEREVFLIADISIWKDGARTERVRGFWESKPVGAAVLSSIVSSKGVRSRSSPAGIRASPLSPYIELPFAHGLAGGVVEVAVVRSDCGRVSDVAV